MKMAIQILFSPVLSTLYRKVSRQKCSQTTAVYQWSDTNVRLTVDALSMAAKNNDKIL